MIIEILFASFAYAKDVCLINDCENSAKEKPRVERAIGANDQDNKYDKKPSVKEEQSDLKPGSLQKKPKNKSGATVVQTRIYDEPGVSTNLPPYLQNLPANEEHEFVFTAKAEANDVLPGVNRGSKLKVIIRQNIKASTNMPTPVIGEVITESMKGSFIYGEATLESDLNRVVFKFSSLGGGLLNSSYTIKASGLDPQGRVGYEGDFHADDWKYGITSFLSTGAAIAVDSQVERSQSIIGGYAEAPSASNAVKKGVAGSLGKVAERMADRAAKVPGYTEIEGPIYLTVVIEDQPKVSR